jgi:hypothetical protein
MHPEEKRRQPCMVARFFYKVKKEWMTFMEAEFDRLDTDKSGELDVREMAQSRLRVTRHTSVGK